MEPKKPITLLGGLTSFGGAGNNYSLHVSPLYTFTRSPLTTQQAIAEMARVIRHGRYQTGLILANGGVLSWQHAICLSAQPKRDGSPYKSATFLDNGQESQGPEFTVKAEGEAIIEVCELCSRFSLSI